MANFSRNFSRSHFSREMFRKTISRSREKCEKCACLLLANKVLHLLSDNTTNWHHFTVTPNSCYCFCYLNSIFILLNTTAECQIQLSSGPAECTECTLQQIYFGKTNSYPAILFQFLRLKDGNMWVNFYLNIKTSIYLKLLQLQSE